MSKLEEIKARLEGLPERTFVQNPFYADQRWLISEVERKSSVHVEQMRGALLDLQYAEAEVERLNSKLNARMIDCNDYEARIEKLRAALEQLRSYVITEAIWIDEIEWMRDLAKEALAEDDKAVE